MSMNEMDSKVKELRELKRMQDELNAEMTARDTDTLTGNDWKVTWKTVTSSRLDTTAIKKALPDLAQQFTKTSTSRRFVLA